MGKDRTVDEMIDYYVDLVNKYTEDYKRNIFYTFEDPLWEHDLKNAAKLTAALEALGVETVGDDAFCTQPDLLLEGIKIHAYSKILIKVNQVGNVLDAIEVIRIARENDVGIIISHRSGETMYPGIAHLFTAFQADALKAGAPQPTDFVFKTDDADEAGVVFSDKTKQVRRVKYETGIENAEKKVSFNKQSSLIILTEYIKESGIKPISKLAGFANVQLIIAGKNANRVKEALGVYGVDKNSVMTTSSAEQALEKSAKLGIQRDKTAVVLTPTEYYSFPSPAGVTLIRANGMVPAEELAMAVYALNPSEDALQSLKTLDQKIADKVITKETKQSLEEMLAELKQGVLAFSDEARYAENVAKKVDSIRDIKEKFLKNI
jgi:hypothetical protein